LAWIAVASQLEPGNGWGMSYVLAGVVQQGAATMKVTAGNASRPFFFFFLGPSESGSCSVFYEEF
jgi:hypothetical protein